MMKLTQSYSFGCSGVFSKIFASKAKSFFPSSLIYSKPRYLKSLKLQPFSVNLFVFFFIIFESAALVLHVLQYFTNFKTLLKTCSAPNLGCAILCLKNLRSIQ